VYGDGQQTRCFCDVRDVVRALIGLACQAQANGRVFNVGSREEVRILDLARRIRALTGSSSELQLVPFQDAYAPGFEDMQRRVPDLTRIQELLGWEPAHDLNDILRSVIVYERGQIEIGGPSLRVASASNAK
jgi:UDP-glucose 4-epimerase